MVLLRAQKISKRFGGTQALKEVYFNLEKGDVHALIGQNGAGKSTFSRIIVGDIEKDGGELFLNEEEIRIRNCIDAKNLGICMIPQELRIVPYMTVSENIFLNQYIKNKSGIISWRKLRKKALAIMEKWGIKLDPDALLQDLPIAKKQLVEILKSLSINPSIIIMDEPTSSLGYHEVNSLFEIIRYLKGMGVSIIYISHILDEVLQISDKITVFRDGINVSTCNTKGADLSRIVELMIGQKMAEKSSVRIDRKIKEEEVLRVNNLKSGKLVNNVSLSLKKGEILGITGLLGSGKTELANCIFGLNKINSGEVFIEGKKINMRSPRDAIKNNIALIPEDRMKDGTFSLMPVNDNICFLILKKLKKFGLINNKVENKKTLEYAKKLDIKFENLQQLLNELSGGNQQKVVICRWLSIDPHIIIADEPTRGIDVGTKKEIYKLLKNIANTGVGIIVFSSEIQEILEVGDRILAMSRGKITNEFKKGDITKHELALCVTGL